MYFTVANFLSKTRLETIGGFSIKVTINTIKAKGTSLYKFIAFAKYVLVKTLLFGASNSLVKIKILKKK